MSTPQMTHTVLRLSPGWYPDPADRGRLRRWDGRSWTSASRSPVRDGYDTAIAARTRAHRSGSRHT